MATEQLATERSEQSHESRGSLVTEFVSSHEWRTERPHVMIIACSDGRYQQSLDEFLSHFLGITHYDRLYAPGGPGALASSAMSYFRGEQFRQESAFLVDAHGLEEIIFIFHGPMHGQGPGDATCADYRRKMPGANNGEIEKQQRADLCEAVRAVRQASKDLRISAYRAEVGSDIHVHFIPMEIEG